MKVRSRRSIRSVAVSPSTASPSSWRNASSLLRSNSPYRRTIVVPRCRSVWTEQTLDIGLPGRSSCTAGLLHGRRAAAPIALQKHDRFGRFSSDPGRLPGGPAWTSVSLLYLRPGASERPLQKARSGVVLLVAFVVIQAEEEVGVLHVRVEGIGIRLDHPRLVGRVRGLRLAQAGLAEIFMIW